MRPLSVGERVRIVSPVSVYQGIEGDVVEIQESTGHATVDVPRGTEERIEGIKQNSILRTRKPSQSNGSGGRKPIPKGDPQWFPMRWLRVADAD